MGRVLETWSLVTPSRSSSVELPVPQDEVFQTPLAEDHLVLGYSRGFGSFRSRLC